MELGPVYEKFLQLKICLALRMLNNYISSLVGYFRKFIQNYAYIAVSLTRLLKKDVQWKFRKEQFEAVSKLK